MQLRKFLESENFTRIPLKKLATGHYRLEAKLNRTKGIFILDTGASTSCVGLEGIERFFLKNETSEIKAAGAGAINMETQLARNNKFQLGNSKFRNVDFVIFDMKHVNEALMQANEVPVHGIIGADFLKKYRAVIDYGRNCLYLKQ